MKSAPDCRRSHGNHASEAIFGGLIFFVSCSNVHGVTRPTRPEKCNFMETIWWGGPWGRTTYFVMWAKKFCWGLIRAEYPLHFAFGIDAGEFFGSFRPRLMVPIFCISLWVNVAIWILSVMRLAFTPAMFFLNYWNLVSVCISQLWSSGGQNVVTCFGYISPMSCAPGICLIKPFYMIWFWDIQITQDYFLVWVNWILRLQDLFQQLYHSAIMTQDWNWQAWFDDALPVMCDSQCGVDIT